MNWNFLRRDCNCISIFTDASYISHRATKYASIGVYSWDFPCKVAAEIYWDKEIFHRVNNNFAELTAISACLENCSVCQKGWR